VTIAALIFVVVTWVVMIWHTRTLDAGALECLFTGLGFVAIVVTLRHAREEATARDEEHRQLLRAMVLQSRVQLYQWQLQNKTENPEELIEVANALYRTRLQLDHLISLTDKK
jgi:hypothetical protein